MWSKIIDLLLAVGPALVDLIRERLNKRDEKLIERANHRLEKRRAKKRHVKEMLDAVDRDDPAGLVESANRVRDDLEEPDSSDPASR